MLKNTASHLGDSFAIDLNDEKNEGTFVSSTGEKPKYTNWDQEPKSQSSNVKYLGPKPQRYVKYVVVGPNGKWTNRNSYLNSAVICQHDPDQNCASSLSTTSTAPNKNTFSNIIATSTTTTKSALPKRTQKTSAKAISTATTTVFTEVKEMTMSKTRNETALILASLLRRLDNFDRLLDVKIENFNRGATVLNPKPRLVFLMVTEDLVKIYVERYKKRQQMKHLTSIFKLTATTVLLSSGLFLLHILFRMFRSINLNYKTIKIAKQKRKRKQKRRLYNT